MSSAAEFEQYFVEGDTQHDSVNEARPTQTLVKNMFISPFWQFVIGATVLNGAYLLGVFGFSLLWLLLGSFLWVACEAYIHNKELYQTVRTDEKSAVLARLEDLPTWVFFPDTERVEWINKIVHQLWPYIGNLVEDLFRDDVEPAIQASLPAYLQSFKFDKLILGDMPPRVGGVKIYNENVARDEIVLDVEMMYSGDCLFSVKMTGLKAGIKDVQFHGTMRIEIKPLLKQLPLVGGIKLFFLTPPTIDFNLTSLANIFDIPGLSDILRTVIVDQLSTVMVLPNKINISLTESVNLRLLKFLQPV
ncbi:extended synaptotagmin-3-like, partial [Limulus polyphemus]|uniref:Extended synaptotagmin-3-like n=1 Tax=Limulus polyphemus TaxID=6850 RepID=A0ABM1BVK4_LIMPO